MMAKDYSGHTAKRPVVHRAYIHMNKGQRQICFGPLEREHYIVCDRVFQRYSVVTLFAFVLLLLLLYYC